MVITSFKGEHEFLSNFHEDPFMMPALPGTWMNSAEHAFQAAKAQSGVDWARIVNQPRAYLAKRAGRTIDCRPDWDKIKRRVMLEVLLAKFTFSADLADRLRATGDAVLVEGNTWGDDYWGAVNWENAAAGMPVWEVPDGPYLTGHNWLGRLLMMVREVIA